MAKQFSENIVVPAIVSGVVALVILLLTPAWTAMADQLSKAIGPALMSFVSVVIVILIIYFCIDVYRNCGILGAGADPETSPERQEYDSLRASLAGDNWPTREYARRLTRFLDGVERFFGDAGTEGQRAFGLETPAPLWTARAFDRCLLLALIYPIATIFVVWAIFGDVGPAEAALGLKPDISGWARGLSAGASGLACFAFWQGARTEGRKSFVWRVVAGPPGLAGAFSGAGFGALALTTAAAFACAFSGAGAAVFPGAFSGTGALVFAVAGVGSFAGVLAAAVAVSLLGYIATNHRWLCVFLLLFLSVMISACLSLAVVLSPLKTWEFFGPLLLFLGLLTLLNAPFDWASLGLTRALLRRGLEREKWWPYAYACLDALFATGIVVLLALTMVVGVQAFDELAVHGGGEKAAVLPLPALFDGIAKHPAAPEYWWAYALLLSTMIPSIINLAIGGWAFTRGIPWLARPLLLRMPEGRAVVESKRPLAAIALTTQMFAGWGLGIAAQAFLVWGLIFHLMPAIGLDLLDMARAVAALDLPARVGLFFAGML